MYENKDDTLENADLEDYMKDTNMRKFTNQGSKELEGVLKYKEISEVLLKMKPDKSPGITGLTAEFFRKVQVGKD